MVKEAISYFNKQVTYECKQTYLSKQVEYKTINATLFEPISANELSAKLRLPSEQIFFRLTTGFPHFVFFFFLLIKRGKYVQKLLGSSN